MSISIAARAGVPAGAVTGEGHLNGGGEEAEGANVNLIKASGCTDRFCLLQDSSIYVARLPFLSLSRGEIGDDSKRSSSALLFSDTAKIFTVCLGNVQDESQVS